LEKTQGNPMFSTAADTVTPTPITTKNTQRP
jgi:hypothetical protein